MMNNMFSMFDPSTSMSSTAWMILAFLVIPLYSLMKKSQSKSHKTMLMLYLEVLKEMNQLMVSNKKMSPNLMSNTFLLIMMMNLIAIIPFNFTPTAHISISFTISMTYWTSVVLFGWTKNLTKMISHLTPVGTPNSLMNFMVVIEMISMLIRPITLSIRLSANMVAGHLLISLLSSFSMMSFQKTFMSMPIMMILTTLELMVSIIQAYVMVTLITLYQNENTA